MEHKRLEHGELLKHGKPFWFAKQIAYRQCIIIAVSNFIAILCIIIVFAAGGMTMSDNNNRDYLIWSDYRVQRQDAFEKAQTIADDSRASTQNGDVSERVLVENNWSLMIVYKAMKGDTVFTKKNIDKMKSVENYLKTFDGYAWQKFCVSKTDTDTSCNQQTVISITD